MLRTALNKSWKDHVTNKELYEQIPRITDTIREQRLRLSGHCWRNISEVVSKVLLWNPQHGRRSRGRHVKTYLDQLKEDTMCTNEELPISMSDRENGSHVL